MKTNSTSHIHRRLMSIAFGVSFALLLPALPLITPPANAVAVALPDFADLVEQSGPAVVNIRTKEKVHAHAQADSDDAEQEFLRRFFGVPDQRQQPSPKPRGKKTPQPQEDDDEEEVPRGVGSGFIISADGYILTNAHVVAGADDVIVRLTDKREFKAKIIGSDERTDVAVLKVEGKDLPKVTIGNSGKVRVGEWVIAIGSPFDLDNSVTAGIVSAKSRETGDFLPLIQTDVAVNPGNSGGPLINLRGEVIGINSQIYSRSGGYMGISFAIPIDEAVRVADQLKANGHVTRGRLGVFPIDVSKEVAESLGLPEAKGALISRLEKDGPAEKAGLLDGDIVLKFKDIPIENSTSLRRLAAATAPNTKVTLSIWRKGVVKDISVVLAELPDTTQIKKEDEKTEQAAPEENSLGISIANITDAEKKEFGIVKGVLIEKAEGPAARAGLRIGDIIITLNNVDVNSPKQFYDLVKKIDTNKTAVLLVRREQNTQYITVKPIKK